MYAPERYAGRVIAPGLAGREGWRMNVNDYQRAVNSAYWNSRPLERLQRLQTENLWLRWIVAFLAVVLIYNLA